jgi:hypothetical protein
MRRRAIAMCVVLSIIVAGPMGCTITPETAEDLKRLNETMHNAGAGVLEVFFGTRFVKLGEVIKQVIDNVIDLAAKQRPDGRRVGKVH